MEGNFSGRIGVRDGRAAGPYYMPLPWGVEMHFLKLALGKVLIIALLHSFFCSLFALDAFWFIEFDWFPDPMFSSCPTRDNRYENVQNLQSQIFRWYSNDFTSYFTAPTWRTNWRNPIHIVFKALMSKAAAAATFSRKRPRASEMLFRHPFPAKFRREMCAKRLEHPFAQMSNAIMWQ